MKLPKFKKYFRSLKTYPWKVSFLSLRFLPKILTKIEKIIILSLVVIIAISTSFIGLNRWLKSTKLISAQGGILREGIIGESKDLDKHTSRLLNAGLTKYDNQKNIVGDIAQNWDINDGGKTYVFHLKPNFSSEDLASQIISQNIWKDIEISTPDPATISFSFKQPFSPFLYASTEPIFNYGPYRITKESKSEIELSARDDYYAGKPFIDKIVLKFYKNKDSLIKAANREDIDGLALVAEAPDLKDFQKLEMKLSRDLMIFFNLSNKDLQNVSIRKALKENAKPDKELNLRLVTSDNQKNVDLANKIVDKWTASGVKVNLDIKDNVTLQKTTIPKRDYDVLLYGLDYGEDPDPYPFWHSSQIKEDGKNLSNFKNTKGDKLLEEARQEFDFKKREDDYVEFQKIIDQEIPAFVVQHENLYYLISKKIYGIEKIIGSSESDRFLNVNQWYINTKRVKN